MEIKQNTPRNLWLPKLIAVQVLQVEGAPALLGILSDNSPPPGCLFCLENVYELHIIRQARNRTDGVPGVEMQVNRMVLPYGGIAALTRMYVSTYSYMFYLKDEEKEYADVIEEFLARNDPPQIVQARTMPVKAPGSLKLI
jgi:hypothetical protein